MAEEITCPACESLNDPWNETCEECGAELYARAAVQDDATDGDAFVEPHHNEEGGDGEPGGFEGVDEEQAYDDANPDYGVDEEFVEESEQEYAEVPAEASEQIHEAVEHGEGELAEIPVEGYELAEDTGAEEVPFAPEDAAQGQPQGEGHEQFSTHEGHDDEPESIEYELEPLEDDGDEYSEDDEWSDDDRPQDGQFDGGAPLDASPDDTFDDWDADDVAADGGAPLEPAMAEQVDELVAESGATFDEFAAEEDSYGEEAAAESEVEEEVEAELPPPAELEAILNPLRADRPPIEPLPTPGPYTELATLSVFKGGEEVGQVAVDFNCTVLGLDRADETAEEGDAEQLEEVDEIHELEAIEPIEAEGDDAGHDTVNAFVGDDAYEFGSLGQPSQSEPSEDSEASELAEESDWEEFEDESNQDSEVDEAPEEEFVYEDPEDLEEGPVVDLSQFGDAARFARRHGYLFRQNKHYTLYVLSDMGTQLNDELLTIGDHRELSDGDVIVLGGEVALKFNEPAA